MSINIPDQIQVFKRGTTILRTDIIKFAGDIQLLTAAGPPSGQYDVGVLFFNNDDKKLYASANYKNNNLPATAWFKFDGNVKDFSGNNIIATLTGGSYEAGQYGKALKIDGVDDKLSIPKAGGWTSSSFNCWIKLPADWANGDQAFFLERYHDATNFYTWSIEGNVSNQGVIRLRIDRQGLGPADNSYTTVPITRNVWTYISIQTQNTSKIVRVDGSSESDSPGFTMADDQYAGEPQVMGNSTLDTSFGNQDYLIDDLKIWGNAKNETPIDQSNLDKNQWASFTGTYVENT